MVRELDDQSFMRILFALPGLHRVNRGAEIAFIAIANELASMGNTVTLIGSGEPSSLGDYKFVRAKSIKRENFESFPILPIFRNEFAYEDLTFAFQLLQKYQPSDFDVTLTCNYPFTNWALRRPRVGKRRPPHVFVTQNGDWPAYASNSEYRFFGCEGLVCINPDYYQRNHERWRCALIPNGVDCKRFSPGPSQRGLFDLPPNRLVVLMVSALEATKRVSLGVEATSLIPDAYLVVAGDGPLRSDIDEVASRLLPGRFKRLLVGPDLMPLLYRSADVFLHLSKVESFGNVFLEAMSTGLPIVASDSPRTRWIVGENECLASRDSPSEIAAQITRSQADSAPRSEERLKRAANFGWSNIATKYQAFLREVIGL